MNSKDLINVMQGWMGAKTGDKVHKTIIDIYNKNKPLPRGYKVKYNDAWCATCVSSASISLGYQSIIPPECSCIQMIKLFKSIGAWVEDDGYTPHEGDIIFYYWGDDGVGDCVSNHASHVGVVEKVNNGLITVIEGNNGGKVARRFVNVNQRYIVGYGVPKYDTCATTNDTTVYYVAIKGDNVTKIAKLFNTTKEDIIKLNNLKYPYWLYVGKKYRIR